MRRASSWLLLSTSALDYRYFGGEPLPFPGVESTIVVSKSNLVLFSRTLFVIHAGLSTIEICAMFTCAINPNLSFPKRVLEWVPIFQRPSSPR